MIDSRFEALRTTTTPFLGRDDEMNLLIRRWRQAEKGEGCVVLICGEPGIGKSRLVQTALDRFGQRHSALCYFCLPHHLDSAFSPVIAQLERTAGFRREDAPEDRLKKLAAVVSGVTADSDDATQMLAALLSIPTGDDRARLALSPQQSKQRTLDALSRWIEGRARRSPLLLVVEDAQWCDPTSKELFDRIVNQAPGLPMLALVTFRPEFAPPWLGLPHVTLLTLSNLPRETSADMVAHVAGRKSLPKEIAEQIIERTDGVPLFIEELTKAVIEGGILKDVGDRYEAVGPSPALAIPTTLNGSLLARPRSLGASARSGAGRCGAGPDVLARSDQRDGDNAERPAGRRSGATRRRGAGLPARHSAARRIHVQARARSGRGVQHAAAQQPPAAAWQDRHGSGDEAPGDR